MLFIKSVAMINKIVYKLSYYIIFSKYIFLDDMNRDVKWFNVKMSLSLINLQDFTTRYQLPLSPNEKNICTKGYER